MPVTRPLLSCSPFLSFQSALCTSGQSCAQCPSFLHNLHFVQVEKSCSLLAHTVHISCAASRAACSFSVSCCSCLCVLLRLSCRRTVEVGVEFQCTPAEPLGRCVFCILAVPASPYFHVGKHKHTVS